MLTKRNMQYPLLAWLASSMKLQVTAILRQAMNMRCISWQLQGRIFHHVNSVGMTKDTKMKMPVYRNSTTT
jgi:hypothetical protein